VMWSAAAKLPLCFESRRSLRQTAGLRQKEGMAHFALGSISMMQKRAGSEKQSGSFAAALHKKETRRFRRVSWD
ncbi:MAG: hypothetical protein ACRD5G_08675, partial [Candidatus Acidiferrales bacterium]